MYNNYKYEYNFNGKLIIRVQFPAMQEFSLLHRVQTGSGAHPTSYSKGTGGDLRRLKRL
jgi:hypothetical protein